MRLRKCWRQLPRLHSVSFGIMYMQVHVLWICIALSTWCTYAGNSAVSRALSEIYFPQRAPLPCPCPSSRTRRLMSRRDYCRRGSRLLLLIGVVWIERSVCSEEVCVFHRMSACGMHTIGSMRSVCRHPFANATFQCKPSSACSKSNPMINSCNARPRHPNVNRLRFAQHSGTYSNSCLVVC